MWQHISGKLSEQRPTRVRLADRTTRTQEAITDEILADAGWVWVEPAIDVSDTSLEPSTSGTLL